MMKDLIEYLTTHSIKVLPSTSKAGVKGAVLPETLDNEQNGTFESLDTLASDIQPLLPEGYRCELLPQSRRYDSDALYIGKERTLDDNNTSVLDAI